MECIDNYIKEKRLELSASILNRKIVYLDINYWIKLREQSNLINPNDKLLFSKITELVESKKCIFPISEISFWEFLKQSDSNTLKETIELVDKFSDGISIINENERIQLEFIHFIRKNTGKDTYDLKELVWSKLAFIVFPDVLMVEPFYSQKFFFDFISDMKLSDIISIIEKNGGRQPFIFKDDIESLNRNKIKYEGENKSFKQMFLSELGGYLDLYQDSLNESMYKLFYQDNGRFPTEEEKIVDVTIYKNMIYNGFRIGKITNELPVFRIFPELFASVRWNKARKFSDGNDTLDFLHASFALPYCDYFFTEKELKTIISQRKLDELYHCKVESDPNKVLNLLELIK